jgi:hypothetical protein
MFPWDSDSCLVSHELPRLVWNRKVYYHCLATEVLDNSMVVVNTNALHIIISCVCHGRLVLFSPEPRSPKWHLAFVFCGSDFEYVSHTSHSYWCCAFRAEYPKYPTISSCSINHLVPTSRYNGGLPAGNAARYFTDREDNDGWLI